MIPAPDILLPVIALHRPLPMREPQLILLWDDIRVGIVLGVRRIILLDFWFSAMSAGRLIAFRGLAGLCVEDAGNIAVILAVAADSELPHEYSIWCFGHRYL